MARQKQLALISKSDRDAADNQIRQLQKEVKYDLRDFTVDHIVREFRSALFYVPPYQRDYVWDSRRKSRFVESVILGLPIPMMFLAEMEDGRLEIVDGAQRIQTLEEFMSNDLRLRDVTKITKLKDFLYSDLPTPQQRKFASKALRIVVLEEATTLEIRQEIFNRVNTSALKANPSEVRRGSYAGAFMQFLDQCAKSKRFQMLCPIGKKQVARKEHLELVLRFFAYSDRYGQFKHDVDKFLDQYVIDHRQHFDKKRMKAEWDNMLLFVESHFPHGFGKSPRSNTTPRVRFEAIAVGVNLALRKRPNLVPADMSWLYSQVFVAHTTTHASNSGPRLRDRVEFVRDSLLG